MKPLKLFSVPVLATSILLGAPAFAEAAKITTPKAVLELFTSQGCSSCPPADRLVEKFAQKGEILAISTHVDYWDYLGWKDSFATSANTQRQYAYARSLRESQVYTPQAVINGRAHVIGSKEEKIKQTVDRLSAASQGLIVPINITVDENRLNINVENHAAASDATLYIFSLSQMETVGIEKGENAGRKIVYHNVLKEIQPVGMLKAGGLSMDFPISELKKNGADCYAIVLQQNDADGNPSAIIGAVFVEDL
ncbi:MAG: DUF1223 domain-containing protein [Pseudomonadota bacterium]